MTRAIVHSLEPVALVGGGVATVRDVREVLRFAPICVAADGGARHLIRAGVVPDAVIGDMDSIDAATRAQVPPERMHAVAEQNSTDFDKALRHISAPLVLGVGLLGGRVDHQLAAFHVLAARAGQRCLLVGRDEVVFLCPPRVRLPMCAGDVVSLVPLAPVQGRSEGLRWPIDGLMLDPLVRIGTSNLADGPVVLDVDAPHLLVILPRARLRALIPALGPAAPQAVQWPVPAGQCTDQPRS